MFFFFFFSSRRRHTRSLRDWSSDVCSSDLQAAVRDPRYTIRELTYLEERITAHLQGVLAVGEVALPLLEDTLAAEDPHMVFAAAYALLHAKNETATARVRDS